MRSWHRGTSEGHDSSSKNKGRRRRLLTHCSRPLSDLLCIWTSVRPIRSPVCCLLTDNRKRNLEVWVKWQSCQGFFWNDSFLKERKDNSKKKKSSDSSIPCHSCWDRSVFCFVCVCMMPVCMHAHVWVYVYVPMHVCVYNYVRAHIYSSVCLCVRMTMCVPISVCMYLHKIKAFVLVWVMLKC